MRSPYYVIPDTTLVLDESSSYGDALLYDSGITRRFSTARYLMEYILLGSEKPSESPEGSIAAKNAEQLRSDVKNIPHGPGSEGSIDPLWQRFLDDLREHILASDPGLFLTWPEVRKSMVYNAPLAEWSFVKKSPLWKNRDVLTETRVGAPEPYTAYPATSGNLVHQAFHIAQLMSAYDIDIPALTSVVELGGGYGCMNRLMRRLGFMGDYAIFDLPEFCALQRYYMSMTGPYGAPNTEWIASPSDISRHSDPNLCIAMWSLSEMPVALREKALSSLGEPDYFLIGYQKQFQDIDNVSFFSTFKKDRPSYTWKEYDPEHLPGSRYLIGKKVS